MEVTVGSDEPGEQDETDEQRRRRRERGDPADTAEGAVGAAEAASGCGRFLGGRSGTGRSRGGSCGDCDCDGCDGCDCNLTLLHLSSLLALAAVVLPGRGTGGLVRALIHGYRRWLTRFTPACAETPSCSAYALAAVEELGPRRGLAATARRVRRCGRGG